LLFPLELHQNNYSHHPPIENFVASDGRPRATGKRATANGHADEPFGGKQHTRENGATEQSVFASFSVAMIFSCNLFGKHQTVNSNRALYF